MNCVNIRMHGATIKKKLINLSFVLYGYKIGHLDGGRSMYLKTVCSGDGVVLREMQE